jgi:hypothetical protein
MIRLCKEANELVAIIVASINTAKSKLKWFFLGYELLISNL